MNQSRSNDTLLASDALLMAYDRIITEFHGRRIGNIIVKPESNFYIIKMYDLPKSTNEIEKCNGIEVKIDLILGNIIELRDFLEPTPFSTLDLPDNTISGKQAFAAGLEAIKDFDNYDKIGELTVTLAGNVYKVTFPLPSSQKSSLGPDFSFQVWIDIITAKVVKILVAS